MLKQSHYVFCLFFVVRLKRSHCEHVINIKLWWSLRAIIHEIWWCIMWLFRTLWLVGQSSQGVCFSTWRRIGSGGTASYPSRTATSSVSMTAKQWVNYSYLTRPLSDSHTCVKTVWHVCQLSNRRMNGGFIQRYPSTVQGTRHWRQWRSTWSWLIAACQVGEG